ncbi:MAG: hypothetical protein AMXMBFR84_40430 [Candidatus Hydrogenedentota bacterium]
MSDLAERLASILACPQTHQPLRADNGALVSDFAHRTFKPNPFGYFDFTLNDVFYDMETTSEAYADEQQASWERYYREFLRPWIDREGAKRVLEVGSGLGMGIRMALADGYDAYGLDIPCLAKFWQSIQNDPAHFLCGDGAAMPFPDGYFDALYTLGVIEHIGTKVGHYTLEPNYWQTRLAFAKELLRVTRPGGRILITCPNKRFPIDIHHEPTDAATPQGAMRFRRWFFDKYGMTLHKTFGTYHLFSLGELRRAFVIENGAQEICPLSMKNCFAFKRTGSLPLVKLAKTLITGYIENMPASLHGTFLNPFLVVEVRR